MVMRILLPFWENVCSDNMRLATVKSELSKSAVAVSRSSSFLVKGAKMDSSSRFIIHA